MKSLYARVVFIFLGAVIVSLFLSLLVITRLFESKAVGYIQDETIKTGQEIIASYIEAYPQHSGVLARGISVTSTNAVNFYGPDGKLRHGDSVTARKLIELDPEAVDAVLAGGVYRSNGFGPHGLVVGLPFEIDGQPYAVFLSPTIGPFMGLILRFFQFELLFSLLFGSILILLAAQYIVKPLKKLNAATRRMSKGDFAFELRSRRQDEIGQLTRSFNSMAKELGTLEQIRQRFVSNVSHEIQSPLTSIKGFTKALRHKKMDEEARMRLLAIIEDETERLSRLGEDLLQLSSLEYEHLKLNTGTYRLDEQLRKAVISLEPQWAPKRLRLELELDEFELYADEDRIYRLWINLLGNAIKFTEPEGTIRLTAVREGEAAVVKVVDSGIGMTEDERGSIFEPFYKADPSRTRAAGGNGIGLSIVKRIVELHRGDIAAESAPGEGTTFTVTLPLSQPPANL
ncbi:HAMP domain-containing histidine kinase [Cohnella fermenti]|uniref:Heme sensor protein HssS n=2 Tax=Cohnella fermenti TaxID=2565925 RepID=A0A4S4BNZ5_9BACL|nr:HAMP domain-containing histidine kinase [Cohnella fermenti]